MKLKETSTTIPSEKKERLCAAFLAYFDQETDTIDEEIHRQVMLSYYGNSISRLEMAERSDF